MRKNTQCQCASQITSVVSALQRENEKLSAVIERQNQTIIRMAEKAMDAALVPAELQIDRMLSEQDTKQAEAGVERAMPRPVSARRFDMDNEPGTVSMNAPTANGGMGV